MLCDMNNNVCVFVCLLVMRKESLAVGCCWKEQMVIDDEVCCGAGGGVGALCV